jgi:hypothetical protein
MAEGWDGRTFCGLFCPLGNASGSASEQKPLPKPGRYDSVSQLVSVMAGEVRALQGNSLNEPFVLNLHAPLEWTTSCGLYFEVFGLSGCQLGDSDFNV